MIKMYINKAVQRFVVIMLLSFFLTSCKAQGVYMSNDSSIVSLKAEIIEKDSQLFLKPILLLNSRSKKIQISEKFTYIDGVSNTNNTSKQFIKLYLSKQLLNTYTYITLGVPNYSLYDIKPGYKVVSSNFKLDDFIELNNYYPLEAGNYMIMLEMPYELDGKHFIVQSQPKYFQIKYIPKNSIY